jgi:quinol monooxygenase YgiN
MLAVTTTFDVEAESLDLFRAGIVKQAEVTRSREPGCHRYDVAFDPKLKSRCLVYAIYEDEAAYDHHIATDYYITFEDISDRWIEKAQVEIWEVVAIGRRSGSSNPMP